MRFIFSFFVTGNYTFWQSDSIAMCRNLTKHLLHYRENGSGAIKQIHCCMCLPSLVELLFYVIWKYFAICLFFTTNLPVCMHASFDQLDQADKQPRKMRTQRPGMWQQVNGRFSSLFSKTHPAAQQAALGLIQRISCTFAPR